MPVKKNFLFVLDSAGKIVDGAKIDSYDDDGTIYHSDVPDRWLVYTVKDSAREDARWNRLPVWEPDPERENRNRQKLTPGYSLVRGTRAEWDEWVSSITDIGLEDIVGRPLVIGSRVAVAFALGRGAEQRVGHIVGFDKTLGKLGGMNVGGSSKIDPRDQIVVEWEKSNARYGGTPETSKIFAALRRAVVIS